MRTIKFRGKSNICDKWLYGNLYAKDRVSYICATNRGWLGVERETVGQFTGLYDKNGNEIYEDDILQIDQSTSTLAYIKWNDEMAQFVIGMPNRDQWYPINGNTEVIGNIHDNPELLKNCKMNNGELKESLGDELCEYCPLKNGQILDLQNSFCEGMYCDEAVENFIEENGIYLDDL